MHHMVDESHPAIRACARWPVDCAVRKVVTGNRLIVGRFEEIGKLVQDVRNFRGVGIVVWDESVSKPVFNSNNDNRELPTHPYNQPGSIIDHRLQRRPLVKRQCATRRKDILL